MRDVVDVPLDGGPRRPAASRIVAQAARGHRGIGTGTLTFRDPSLDANRDRVPAARALPGRVKPPSTFFALFANVASHVSRPRADPDPSPPSNPRPSSHQVGGDYEFIMGLMQTEFFHSAKEKTARCAEAAERLRLDPTALVKAESMKTMAFEAHAMKGSALTLCAKTVGAQCARLELVCNGRSTDASPDPTEDDPKRLVADIERKIDELFAHVAEIESIDSFPLAQAAERFSDTKELGPRIATLAVDACVAFQAALGGDKDAAALLAAVAKDASTLGATRLASTAESTSRLCVDVTAGVTADVTDPEYTAECVGEYQFAVESFAWDAWQVLGSSLPDVWAKLRRTDPADPESKLLSIDVVEYATVRPTEGISERVATIAERLRRISENDGGNDRRSSMDATRESQHPATSFASRSGNPCDFIRLVRNLGGDNQFAFNMLRGFVNDVDVFVRGIKALDVGDASLAMSTDERTACGALVETSELLSSHNLGEALQGLLRSSTRGGGALRESVHAVRESVHAVEDAAFELRSFCEGLARAQMASTSRNGSRAVSRVSRESRGPTDSLDGSPVSVHADLGPPDAVPIEDSGKLYDTAEEKTTRPSPSLGADFERKQRRASSPGDSAAIPPLSPTDVRTPRRSDSAMHSTWFNAKYGGDVGGRLREASWVLQQRRSSRASKSSASTGNSLRNSIDVVRESDETRGSASAIANLAPRELREVLSSLNVPGKTAEGLIVNLGDALVNSDGNWDFVLGCVSRYAGLAREQFEVLKMLLNPKRCESKPVTQVVTEVLVSSARSIAEGASVCCAPNLHASFERMENVLVAARKDVSSDGWVQRVAHALSACEHKLCAYETCVRGLSEIRTFAARDLVTKTCGGDLEASVDLLRKFLRGAYGAQVLAADAFAAAAEAHAHEHPASKPPRVAAKLVEAKAALSACERRAAGIGARGSVVGATRRAVAHVSLIARDFGASPEALTSAEDVHDTEEVDSTVWAKPPVALPVPTYGDATFGSDRFRIDSVAGLLDLKAQIERLARDAHKIAPRDMPGDPTVNPDAYLAASHDDVEHVERKRHVAFKASSYPRKKQPSADDEDAFEGASSGYEEGMKRVSAALVDGVWIRAFIGFFITSATIRIALMLSAMEFSPA